MLTTDWRARMTMAGEDEGAGGGEPAADAAVDAPADPGPLAAGGGEDPDTSAPADWPEDWRAKLAGEDEKLAKRLDRFKSPKDILQAWRNAESKISSGELKAALPKDATEEQVAAWRQENGIPETPAGYLDALPDGLVLGDDDKPYAEAFAAKMHEMNAPPEMVAQAIAWDRERQEQAAAQRAEADKAFRAEAEDRLRGEWGAEYRANINALTSFLDATNVEDGDTSVKDLLLGARLADGTVLGDNPLALKWLVNVANEINPAGTVVPGSGASQASSIADEIKEIEGYMRKDRAAYNKDVKAQERLRQLYEAQEKLSSRAA